MQLTLTHLEKHIKAIHDTAPQVVIEFAGAGVQALAWLHGIGGSSRTILEATDRYAAPSLIGAIGFEPEKFVSPQVARALATQAFIRAGRLAESGTPIAGIGCTATIATDRLKRGEHNCCIAICDSQGVTMYTLRLAKGRRTRLEEENLVSLLILRAVARVCQVNGLPAPQLFKTEQLIESTEAAGLIDRLLAGEFNWVAVSPDGRLTPGQIWPNLAFLSGSFNPLHEGHRQMVEVASEILQRQVYFELPLINADKAPLDVAETRRRIAQFAGYAPVILSRAPLFSQKAEFFPHCVFVIGADTAERLVQLRFYNHSRADMHAAFHHLRAAGCRFLVAGRVKDGRFFSLHDIEIPERYRTLFEPIPEEQFRIDISSTEIREGA